MEELKGKFQLAEREPGDVSANEMAEATKLSRSYCNARLNQLVDKGELVKVKVRGKHGQPETVYRKVIYRKVK